MLALLTGCSGGGSTPAQSKVGLKVVFSNTSSVVNPTIKSLGAESIVLDIIPANPALGTVYKDLSVASALNTTIFLPDPVSPATSEPYLFRITAWTSSGTSGSKIFYCGQKLVNIVAGVNPPIDLTAFSLNGFDPVAGKYTVNGSDGTIIPLSIDVYGRGSGISSAGSFVTTYLAPTATGLYDVAVVAVNSGTLAAHGSGSLNAGTGTGSGSVTDNTGLQPTWTVTKNKVFTSAQISGKIYNFSTSGGQTGTITCNADGTYSQNNGTAGTWSINTAGQLLFTSSTNIATLTLNSYTATTFTATESDTSPPGALSTVTCTLVPNLVSIAVSPANQSVAAGSSQQFTATGTYSDASTGNLTSSAIWSSSNTSVATIASGGLAQMIGTGSSTITARYGSITGTATITSSTGSVTATW